MEICSLPWWIQNKKPASVWWKCCSSAYFAFWNENAKRKSIAYFFNSMWFAITEISSFFQNQSNWIGYDLEAFLPCPLNDYLIFHWHDCKYPDPRVEYRSFNLLESCTNWHRFASSFYRIDHCLWSAVFVGICHFDPGVSYSRQKSITVVFVRFVCGIDPPIASS